MNFYYIRSMLVGMGLLLMLGLYMAVFRPGIEIFQTGMQQFKSLSTGSSSTTVRYNVIPMICNDPSCGYAPYKTTKEDFDRYSCISL